MRSFDLKQERLSPNMAALIIRFQFSDFKSNELVELLKQRYGGGLSYISEGTFIVDTDDSAKELYQLITPFFTFDDKLFVGELNAYYSLHHVSRPRTTAKKTI
jgi:hypothetical protein